MAERIRLFLDQHVPAAVAQGLRRRGVDALTVQEAGRCGLPDEEQLHFAHAQGRVMVTHDDDFMSLAATGVPHSGIAFCSATKFSIGELIYALLLFHEVLTPGDMQDHVEFL